MLITHVGTSIPANHLPPHRLNEALRNTLGINVMQRWPLNAA